MNHVALLKGNRPVFFQHQGGTYGKDVQVLYSDVSSDATPDRGRMAGMFGKGVEEGRAKEPVWSSVSFRRARRSPTSSEGSRKVHDHRNVRMRLGLTIVFFIYLFIK